MKIFKFWLLPIIWAGVIFTFSSMKTHTSSGIYWQEFVIKKTAHLIEYSIFFCLLYRAIINTTKYSKFKSALFAFIILVLYAMSDELHQSFTPGREPTTRDVIIDTLGGALSWIALVKLLPKAPKKLKTLAMNLQIQ